MGTKDRLHVPISEAQERHRLAPSRISRPVLALTRLLSPLYARFVLHYVCFDTSGLPPLLDAMRSFQAGRTRLILAFRHPYGNEPQLLHHVLDSLLPRFAKKRGLPLQRRPHPRFVHGYEVALWGDALIRWLLPRTGAVPIHHLQADPAGMKAIRSILLDDPSPLALAPEGQVSYRSATVPRLEPGTARMAFWCVKDLERAGRPEHAVILPVTILHEYRQRDAARLVALVRRLEVQCGLTNADVAPITEASGHPASKPPTSFEGRQPADNPGFAKAIRNRLVALESRVLAMAETHYAVIRDPSASSAPTSGSPTSGDPTGGEEITDLHLRHERPAGADGGAGADATAAVDPVACERAIRQRRWDALMETALETGERLLGMTPHHPQQEPQPTETTREAILEERIARVYRIRREGWERIFPRHPIEGLSRFERAMKHRQAGEAWYAMRHMEFVDLMEYLDPDYLDAENIPDGPSYNRLVETALNLYDLVQRLSGGNFTNRIQPFPMKAVVLAGNPVDVSERLPEYRRDMRKAVADVTHAMKDAYLETLDKYAKGANG